MIVGTNGYKRGTNVWHQSFLKMPWWKGFALFSSPPPPQGFIYCEYVNEVQTKWLLIQTDTDEVQTFGIFFERKRFGGLGLAKCTSVFVMRYLGDKVKENEIYVLRKFNRFYLFAI